MIIAGNKIPMFAFCLFFFLVCFALYFNGLNNGFVLDDNYLVVNNPYVQNMEIKNIFSSDVFYFRPKKIGDVSRYYRPLQLLSYSLEYSIWKLNPAGYRIVNIILQSANSLLVMLIIYFVFKDLILAFLSSVFFCIHPAQVCLVNFISGRSNLLELFFILVSILGFIYYSIHKKTLWYYYSLFLFVMALLTREGALLLPIYIFVCAMFLNIEKKRIFKILIPYIAIALFYLWLRSIFMPSDKLSIFNLLSLQNFVHFFFYLQDFFWQLVFPLSLKTSLFNNNLILKLILYTCSFFTMIFFLTRVIILRNRAAIFGFAMYFIGLAPVIKLNDIMKYFGPALTEHYVYNASIGFCILLSCLVLALYTINHKALKISFILLCLYFSVTTIFLNSLYKDEFSFYRYVLSTDKDNTIAHLNLGNAYFLRKDYNRAIKESRIVLQLEPNAWDAYLLLGNVFKEKKEFIKAKESYEKAFISNPHSDIALNNLGLIYMEEAKFEKSMKFFSEALEINPESTIALENIAALFIKKRDYDKALVICERLFTLNPYDVKALIAIGVYWARAGYFKEAELFFTSALKISPNSYEALKNLGAIYGNMGNFDKAIIYFKKALGIKPDDQELKSFINKTIMLKRKVVK